MKVASVLGFAAMLAALLGLLETGSLFSPTPWVIALQASAALLMIWARLAFGARSFHAAANPTAGGMITRGPYRYLRHPIYAAVCLFVWAGVLGNPSLFAMSLGALATGGAIVRLFCEERLLLRAYPDYREYAGRTKRLLPWVW